MDITAVSASRRREQSDCFNCAAIPRVCDRARHRCQACQTNNEVCQGYPRNLQWLSGVTSRGKMKGTSLSITSANQTWRSSAVGRQSFKFKEGRPQRKRRLGPRTPEAGRHQQSVDASVNGRNSSSLPSEDIHAGLVVNDDDVDHGSPDAHEWFHPGSDSLQMLDFGNAENTRNTFDSFLPLSEFNQDDSLQSTTGNLPLTAGASPLASILPPGPEELLSLYDNELCCIPLTFDFETNPFRCRRDTSQGSKHLLHAILAVSVQHMSRLQNSSSDDAMVRQVREYKHSAMSLYTEALRSARTGTKISNLDTMLILFSLEGLISGIGPWNTRLSDAFKMIESLGGIKIIASSPRLQAQAAMFLWWDCSVALLARSACIFPQSYYNLLLSCDGRESWNIFSLSGVPKQLFWHLVDILQLASEKEQTTRMKYATFNMERVLELEQCIQEYSEGEDFPAESGNDEEDICHWHDCYNTCNAWKYALLLYISRVFKWDRSSNVKPAEITSLARLTLDSIRCCRSTSSLQKQLLFPAFIAGSESDSLYSRRFAEEYCEDWYQKCRYGMFRDALNLLKRVWMERDMEKDKRAVWWGSVIDDEQRRSTSPLDSSHYLFG